MGMGTMSVTAIIIDNEIVEKIAPKEYAAVRKAEEEYCGPLFEAAQYGTYEDDHDGEGKKAVEALQAAFLTRTGMTLHLGYLDEDYAERYDDFTGSYFELDSSEVFVKSPAALQFEEDFDTTLETQHSTAWG